MFTCNGLPILGLRLKYNFEGLPHATVEVSADEAISGACTIESSDGDEFKGYIVRTTTTGGRCNALVVGGSGGLRNDLTATHAQGITVGDQVKAVCAELGETLDSSAQRGPLGTALPFWSRGVSSGGEELSRLAYRAKAYWRGLPNGKLWFGVDSWSTIPDNFDATVITTKLAGVCVATDRLLIVPGKTWRGYQVSAVEYSFNEKEHMRANLWLKQ